jgi:hypothetical protein
MQEYDKYNFTTDNIYSKYNLETFLNSNGFDSSIDINVSYSASTSGASYTGGLYYNFYFLNQVDIPYFTGYTYVSATTSLSNVYILLITEINDSEITIVTSPNMENYYLNNINNPESIIKIQTLSTIHDISTMLNECYINIQTV